MVELIIQESGFPLNRPNLLALQEYTQTALDNILKFLPGTRVIEGFVVTDHGDNTMSTTAGVIAHKGKLYTIDATNTVATETLISFNEVTTQSQFNTGSEANPVYEDKDERITRTAVLGNSGEDDTLINDLYRDRNILETLKFGSSVIGPVVFIGNSRIVEVEFTELPTQFYFVLGRFRPINPTEEFTQPFSWNVISQNTTGFRIRLENVSGTTNTLVFDYTLIPRNFINLFT